MREGRLEVVGYFGNVKYYPSKNEIEINPTHVLYSRYLTDNYGTKYVEIVFINGKSIYLDSDQALNLQNKETKDEVLLTSISDELRSAEEFFDNEIGKFDQDEKYSLLWNKKYCIGQLVEYRIRRNNSKFGLRDCLDIIRTINGIT